MSRKCNSCRWTYEDVQEGAMMPRKCDWYEVCIYEQSPLSVDRQDVKPE